MFDGQVEIEALVRENSIQFPRLEYAPSVPGVVKVTLEATAEKHDRVTGVVYLANVPTQDLGRRIAQSVAETAADRLAYRYGLKIDHGIIRHATFSETAVKTTNGSVAIAFSEHYQTHETVHIKQTNNPVLLKQELEQKLPRYERFYGLYRSTLLSAGDVERFMHLYNVLMMFFDDKQWKVNAFITTYVPGVAQTANPMYPSQSKQPTESLYTRLRNEFAHKRAGVNLEATKNEMAAHVSGLADSVKRAIEQQI